MNQEEAREMEISHEFDYSNIVPEIQGVSFLVQYCESYYNQMIKMCEEDEEKNQKLKSEYKFYQYKKSYNAKFDVVIKEKNDNVSRLSCKTYESFIDAVNNKHLNNVESVVITLDLSFKRGKDLELSEHENIFKISFMPYNIIFTRKSNYEDENMDQIENIINEILKKFRVQNTIFCTK